MARALFLINNLTCPLRASILYRNITVNQKVAAVDEFDLNHDPCKSWEVVLYLSDMQVSNWTTTTPQVYLFWQRWSSSVQKFLSK